MYGALGHIPEARGAFQRTRLRNEFSWTIMLAVYAQNGHLPDAKECFHRMPRKTTVSWNALITGLAESGDVAQARRMFDSIPEPDTASWNAMVTALAQEGDLEDAKLFFTRMPEKDVISWTAMLTAYARAGSLFQAKEFFDRMPSRNLVSWNSFISACSQNGESSLAKASFERIPYRDPISWSSVLPAYACQPSHALDTFLKRIPLCGLMSWVSAIGVLVQQGLVSHAAELFDRIPCRNVIVANAMVSAYALSGHMNRALKLFAEMEETDVISWTALISGYAKQEDLGAARELFDRMPVRDVVAWNAMLEIYAQRGHLSEAVELFQLMDLDGTGVSKPVFITLLSACVDARDLSLGKVLYKLAVESDCGGDVVLTSVLVNLYAKCGDIVSAREIFNGIANRDLIVWNGMLSAYAQNGHFTESLEAFMEMLAEGVEPDDVTFICVLFACSHKGLLQCGLEYFLEMEREFGRERSLDQFISVIDLLGRVGKLEDAEELIKNMPFEPDVLSWKTLLCAAAIHGDVERGGRAARRIALDFEVQSWQLDGEATPFILLFNLLSLKR